MSAEKLEEILEQVNLRYNKARQHLGRGRPEEADKELSDLRDLLDDIYDRPEEQIKAEVLNEQVKTNPEVPQDHQLNV